MDMKGYRITSRTRFIAFVAAVIILFTMMFNLIFALSTAHSESVEQFTTIGVSSGDSLWSIAETYMPDTDTREAVYIIKKINDLDNDYIYAGMMLDIPA
ncbi:MAG: LysM peptidoglycan-binding domain-containing protein [Clostridiales bacterium]|nr:LysM peptidoglycan-binding domain-containing protein [Bacillota bacterium]MCR4708651.1 LysM peptidoglycan-binding domain-containing protein [Clostridiales bacterium]